ncbi:MAG TPA: hypothetical protein VF846_16130 [Thermoanaerobaculia bacterium]|jgi:hypothetical protein
MRSESGDWRRRTPKVLTPLGGPSCTASSYGFGSVNPSPNVRTVNFLITFTTRSRARPNHPNSGTSDGIACTGALSNITIATAIARTPTFKT